MYGLIPGRGWIRQILSDGTRGHISQTIHYFYCCNLYDSNVTNIFNMCEIFINIHCTLRYT